MTVELHDAPPSRKSAARAILVVGALLAVVDGLFAVVLDVVVLHVCTTAELFQYIASSVLGRASFRGGSLTVALGVLFHVGVAFGWTAVYVLARSRWEGLRRVTRGRERAAAVGVAYGLLIWLVMDLVIVPSSRAHATPFASRMFFIMAAWHMIAVGPLIALGVRSADR